MECPNKPGIWKDAKYRGVRRNTIFEKKKARFCIVPINLRFEKKFHIGESQGHEICKNVGCWSVRINLGFENKWHIGESYEHEIWKDVGCWSVRISSEFPLWTFLKKKIELSCLGDLRYKLMAKRVDRKVTWERERESCGMTGNKTLYLRMYALQY